MSEDAIYRTSTQYRLWSFTPSTLHTLRSNTNSLASSQVLAAKAESLSLQPQNIPATRGATPSSGNVSEADKAGVSLDGDLSRPKPKSGADSKAVEPLTMDEELKVVRHYGEKILELGKEYKPPLPTSVLATAIIYLSRFYLSQSPQIYPPSKIMPSALFFALKTDNYYIELDKFITTIPKCTRSDVLDQEYLLLRTLRYTMDVRHPFRGLEGGIMELLGMAEGKGEPAPGRAETPREMQLELQAIQNAPSSKGQDMSTRIANAHSEAKSLLRTAAVLTDAYYLYTPSQIWLAALSIADEPLFTFYISTRFPSTPAAQPIYAKVLKTITACADMLRSYASATESDLKELKRIGKKLYHIQKLQERGSLALQAGTKHLNSVDSDAEIEARKKKRRLERERGLAEGDVFGGPLVAVKDEGGGGEKGDWSD